MKNYTCVTKLPIEPISKFGSSEQLYFRWLNLSQIKPKIAKKSHRETQLRSDYRKHLFRSRLTSRKNFMFLYRQVTSRNAFLYAVAVTR